MLICGFVIAQQQEVKLKWPRTFSGQPDFDFDRDEVVNERKEKKEENEEILAEPSTWDDVMIDKKIDPFLIGKQDKENKNNVTITKMAGGDTLASFADISFSGSELPTLGVSATIDLSNFKNFLENIIDDALTNAQPNYTQVNVQSILDDIRVQSIVKSPNKYVMINGQKFVEKDILLIQIPLMPIPEEIVAEVDANMPDPVQIGKSAFKQYKDMRDSVVKEFNENRQNKPRQYRRNHPLMIKIESIKSRKVVIGLMNEHYDIELKYAF